MNQEQIDALVVECDRLRDECERLVVENDRLRFSEAKARLSSASPARLVSLYQYEREHGLAKAAMMDFERRWRGRGFPEPVATVPYRLYSEIEIDMFRELRRSERAARAKAVDELPWWTCRQKRESRRKGHA